ncbi:retrotransposon protein, putative, ty1-copia subclass [Tanacetum coccineum]
MLNELRKMFEKPPAVEIYDLVDTLHSCKQAPGKSVSASCWSLNKDFGDFVRNFNMHCVGKTVSDLHALLIDFEKGLKDKAPTPQQNPPQKKENPKKDQACHHCNVVGHWKRNCPLYLEELRTNKNKSRYGYVYLLKHKHEVFETFKVFKSEVELQLGKKIKALRSDRGGEYLSQEFKEYLGKNGIVPTKKVDKTPYEIWHGKVPNLSYLKVWGCEAYVKRDSADKLQQRSVKCIFVGYPKETMGYYFYFPPENKVIVARYGDFLERDLISQEFSGRDYDLEDDHMDTLPSENTSEIPVEPESLGPPPELIPIRRSERNKSAPNRLNLNIEVEDDVVGDLGEPANYKAAMLDPDKVIWQGAMDEEMNSMKVNEVWIEVDPPPNAKVVRSKWLFKKKTDMDGEVHTYKARLVAKGCTQTYGIDYEETFSPVADIRTISDTLSFNSGLMMMRFGKGMLKCRLEWLCANGSEHEFKLMEMCASTPEEVAYMKKVPLLSAVAESIYVRVRCTRPDVAFAQNLV